ncbi:ribosome-associated translation inhibitor RaiA [Egibacter rhizosphaerae]|uniref:Ribosome hibernation promoting factor n=1 Tax=Egibacter rhizosphaerae TaxID=1670831 RepID=A0A411YDA1_9ACTN|nr:ribosome-associated translation inhibitor RaiA [Egibacter rhizosphaerae]QBI19194.1 ribosome-associated translation inhibitor RaiA [Egibacter rhizosphaerae]
MDVIVKTKDCDVSERLKDDAVARVQHATRFFDRLLGIEMLFSEEQNPRIPEPAVVEITARTKGHHIRARGAGADHRGAVEAAVGRFERQLRKYKARLVDRRRKAGNAEPSSTEMLPPQLVEAANGDGPAEAGPSPESVAAEVEPSPRIVRHKQFEIGPMLPEEAALQLELLGHDFFFFTNSATGRENVLYRRRDGDLGLIEPAEQAAPEAQA